MEAGGRAQLRPRMSPDLITVLHFGLRRIRHLARVPRTYRYSVFPISTPAKLIRHLGYVALDITLGK